MRREAKPRRTHDPSAALLVAALLLSPLAAHAHPHSPLGDRSKSNRDYYIQLGEAVHGGFGPLIALGIRIGDDAMKTLGAGPRQVEVTYTAGASAPCPCVADGIMIVTASSPGQGTLKVQAGKLEGRHGVALFKHRRTGRQVEYVIPLSIDKLVAEGMTGGPDKRWDVMMDAPEAQLFVKRIIENAN